jgi:Ribbon-helix-helix protein, copG family
MEKIEVALRKEELEALRKVAARSGRGVAEVIRDAIREVMLSPSMKGPVAIWDGEPKRAITMRFERNCSWRVLRTLSASAVRRVARLGGDVGQPDRVLA